MKNILTISVTNNSVKHNPTFPLLFGEIGEENKIIERKAGSVARIASGITV